MEFRILAEEITLTFAHNAWSGAVEILTNGTDAATLSLTAGEGTNDSVTHTIDGSHKYTLGQILIYGGSAWGVLTFLLLVPLMWLKKWGAGQSTTNWNRCTVAALFFLNALFLFFTCDQIRPTRLTKLALLLLTLAAGACFTGRDSKVYMERYHTRTGWMAIGAISVYAALASFAQRFFLDGNTRIHGSFPGIVYCVSGALWFFPIIWLLLFCLEWLSVHRGNKNKKICRKRVWWTLFGVLAICQMMILWILWPGGFPSDAIDQLYQANGVNALNDWHPVLFTLLEKAVLSVVPVPGVLTAVQMMFFVWLLTAFLMIGYDHGLSLRMLCVLGCVFELLPNQALSWSNVLKDFPFTLALLWGTYLLLHLARGSTWSRKWSFCFCLTLDLFFILGFRHNGIVPFAAVALLCVVLTIRYFSRKYIRTIFAVCIAAVSFAVFKGPVFKMLDVRPNGMSPYTTMLCAVGSCINKGLPLSDGSNQIMETVLPLKDWANYYSRYSGHNQYIWGRPEGSAPYDTSQVTAKDAFTVYFDALFKYPDVVIKDRLDGMDIMWDVVQPADGSYAKSFNFISTFDPAILSFNTTSMVKDDYGSFHKTAFLAQAYDKAKRFSINSLFDNLLWRTGAYLIVFLVLALFWWKNHMGRIFWAAVPLMGNLFASILVLYHQSFRYVYFIQVIVAALLFCSVCLRDSFQKRWKKRQNRLRAGSQ